MEYGYENVWISHIKEKIQFGHRLEKGKGGSAPALVFGPRSDRVFLLFKLLGVFSVTRRSRSDSVSQSVSESL